MNDLEHDLRELFDLRVRDVDAPGLAPKTVLKRGRRRQVGTVAMGVLACVVAVGVAAVAIGQARHPAVIPGANDLPARTTSIGGVPVTAPAGWTLVDDYPLALVLPTEQRTCSFSATGAAIDGNGSPVEGDGSPLASQAGDSGRTGEQSCTDTTSTYPAGVPVFQLANWEIPLGESVCGRGNYMDQATLPNNGVAVYVADTLADPNVTDLLRACGVVSNESSGGLLGSFMDTGHHTFYEAVGVVGPDASAADVQTARDYISSLAGIEVTPTVPPIGPGPGYVMAAGDENDTSWRLEAGLTSLGTDGGEPAAGAIMITTSAGQSHARTVDLPAQAHVADDSVDLDAAGAVQFGTATADVTRVDVDLPSGETIAASMFVWPSQIVFPTLASNAGWVWVARTPERGDVRATVPTAPTTAPVPSDRPTAGRLQTTTDDQGRYTVFGNNLGHEWSFHREQDGSFSFFLDGVDQAQGVVLTPGGEAYLDIPGGTLALAIEPAAVTRLFVTSDVAGDDVVANGAWAPSSPGTDNSRVWVEALPGSGAGYEWTGGGLPIAIGWPTNPTPSAGDLVGAGSTPTESWAETWSAQGCPTLQVVAAINDGDLGSSACPVPWDPQQYPNRVSYVGGVSGQQHATVWMLGPAEMQADATSTDDPKVGGYCGGSIANIGRWAQTGECIFVIPVGQTWVIHPTVQDGTPLSHTITVTARPGRIDWSESNGSDAMPSP